jgi:hypothetical protein
LNVDKKEASRCKEIADKEAQKYPRIYQAYFSISNRFTKAGQKSAQKQEKSCKQHQTATFLREAGQKSAQEQDRSCQSNKPEAGQKSEQEDEESCKSQQTRNLRRNKREVANRALP